MIELVSRYGDKYKLIPIEDNLYRADFGKMTEWIRFGGEGIDGYYEFVDPPGGPFISVGNKINDRIVDSIKIDNGIFITLKDDDTVK